MQSEKEARPLDASFYDRPSKLVAVELLGKTILRRDCTTSVKAVIIDVEAYGPSHEDSAVVKAKGHRALSGRKPGLVWIYHLWGGDAFEVTTKGPGSVLVRGISLELAENRYKVIRGPIKTASSLRIDRILDESDLTQTSPVFIYQSANVIVHKVETSNRVNLLSDTKEHRRFFVRFKDLEITQP